MYFAGQYRLLKLRQVEKSLSWTISQPRSFSSAAFWTFSKSFSKSYSGVWTPKIVSPFSSYFSCHARSACQVFWQLYQV